MFRTYIEKIPHMGDTESFNLCKQQHRYQNRPKQTEKQEEKVKKKCSSPVTCHLSHVTHHLSLRPTATATDPPPNYGEEAGQQRPKNFKNFKTQKSLKLKWVLCNGTNTDDSRTLRLEKRILQELCLRFSSKVFVKNKNHLPFIHEEYQKKILVFT